jgi:hypothetical protein
MRAAAPPFLSVSHFPPAWAAIGGGLPSYIIAQDRAASVFIENAWLREGREKLWLNRRRPAQPLQLGRRSCKFKRNSKKETSPCLKRQQNFQRGWPGCRFARREERSSGALSLVLSVDERR